MKLRTGLLCLAALALAAPSTLCAQGDGPTATYGAFNYFRRTDEMTDEDRSFIANDGDASGHRDLVLLWQCTEDGLYVSINTGFMGGNRDDEVTVRYRFDTDPASEDEFWDQSSNSRGAFLPDDLMAEFTARARTAQRVVIRVTDPLDGEVKTKSFSLTGFTRAISRLPCEADVPQPPAAAHLRPRGAAADSTAG